MPTNGVPALNPLQTDSGFPGESLILRGQGLEQITRVLFAGQSLPIQFQSASQVTVLLPEGNIKGQLEAFTENGRLGGFLFSLQGSSGSGGGGGGGGGGVSANPSPTGSPETATTLTRVESEQTLVIETQNIEALRSEFPALTFTQNQHVITVEGPGQSAEMLYVMLSPNAFIDSIEFDTVMQLPPAAAQGGFTLQHLPNDPLYGLSLGALTFQAPWSSSGFEAAWNTTQGSANTRIALIGSGMETAHPEFSGRWEQAYDIVQQQSGVSDSIGQGTRWAGLVAAAMDNNTGTTGGCPACHLMPIKVTDAQGQVKASHLARAIYYAVDQGARVICLAPAGGIDNTVQKALQYAQQNNVLSITGAGEQGKQSLSYPAAYSVGGVLTVSALEANLTGLAAFSNWGPHLSMSAPGQYLLSTWPMGSNTDETLKPPLDANHGLTSGTSAAAAMTAAAAGLIISAYPELSASQVKAALIRGAVDKGPQGFDTQYGWGTLNASAALSQALLLRQAPLNHAPTGIIKIKGIPIAGQTIALTAQIEDQDQDPVSLTWESSAGILSSNTSATTWLTLPESGNLMIRLKLNDGKTTSSTEILHYLSVRSGNAALNFSGGLF